VDIVETTKSPWRKTLDQLDRDGRQRKLKTITQPRRPVIELEGRQVLDFCNNDYLGLSQHPRLIEAAREALATYGTGTGGARLIGGTFDLHTELETAVAAFKGTPAALVFNSGYQANVGVLSALVGRHDTLFADRLNHASLVDGALLSRALHVRYPHLDLGALEKGLAEATVGNKKFIVTDTVFSMDGDLAPLAELYDLAVKYEAWLILDEAHATGLYGGDHRSGLWETTGLGHRERVIQVGTFSKALGSFGAYVAGSREVIDMLVQFSRSFVYSTSLPPAVVGANREALRIVTEDGEPTARLWENIRFFAAEMSRYGIDLPVQGAIFPIAIGEVARTLDCADRLLKAGFYVQAIRPPTVPEGTARLRVTLSAVHTPEQVKALAEALGTILH
jgi:8-amino-7-oxononanoate synthase